MKKLISTQVIVISILIIVSCTVTQKEKVSLSDMAITVSAAENRPISFTNKEAAFWYTQSALNDHPEHAFFEGLTIAKQKVFNGYDLFVEGEKLDNSLATVDVLPHKLLRKHDNGIVEEFWLFDHKNALKVVLSSIPQNQKIAIRLKGLNIESAQIENNITYFTSTDHHYTIAVHSIGRTELEDSKIVTAENPIGYLITVAKDKKTAQELIREYETSNPPWEKKRERRMYNIINKNNIHSNNDSLNKALHWLTLTMDQLVTRQQGHGIYAGLPWFSEYWGRDEFISMPGACLVLGEFDVAKKILKSFAYYQETNPASKFFGRVPNIVNPQLIDYHTTDGTPRFIIQLREYVRYSGDTSIIDDLYENIKFSIEGSIKNWTDEKGYLLHEDNETWMDARRNYDKMPYSPRGTRANDIQALWYQQLLAGVYFTEYMVDSLNAQKWRVIAEKIKANFENDFTSSDHDFIADRIDKNDKAQYRLRPNQLFTFELLANSKTKQKALRKCWQELVYPWGVASLDRNDAFFHPFHLQWANYHKDEAYHNGTIWLWLNGIAMQRMLEINQSETAYELFNNMNRQALTKGVVGGMAENMDAYPRKDKSWPKLTGTYLQAWSNAEQLRVWYQYFLGIRPDMVNKNITLAPRIPDTINELESNIYISQGHIAFGYKKNDKQEYSYSFNKISSKINIDIIRFDPQTINVNKGNTLKLIKENDHLTMLLYENDHESRELFKRVYEKSEARIKEQIEIDKTFKDIEFCKPLPLEQHKVLNKKFDGDRGI